MIKRLGILELKWHTNREPKENFRPQKYNVLGVKSFSLGGLHSRLDSKVH